MKETNESSEIDSEKVKEAIDTTEEKIAAQLNEDDASATAPADGEDIFVPLEALLFDDDQPYEPETTEESARFENFLSEYKAQMSKTLLRATEINNEDSSDKAKKTTKKQKNTTNKKATSTADKTVTESYESEDTDEWDSGITLMPETYEAPDEEDNIFRDSPLPEEEADDDSFSIGREYYGEEDDEIQLSIKFEELPEEVNSSSRADDRFRYDPEHPRLIDNIYDFIELFVATLVCVMLLTTFLFKHSVVEGRSMQNTLQDGDSLIITDMFYTPKRYDIVVFEDYSTALDTYDKAVVKRVIGLPGEKVEVKLNENGNYEVYINDELLPEEYALNTRDTEPDGTGVWYVGEDEIFVMGDNRYHSTDSRHKDVGPINIDSILGKVVLRFYPFDKFGKVE